MNYIESIRAAQADPQQLETIFQQSQKDKQATDFKTGLLECYTATPDNLLLAAWYYRLKTPPAAEAHPDRQINWALAVPLSIALALIVWWLSDDRLIFRPNNVPYLAILGPAIIGLGVNLFMTLTAKHRYGLAASCGAGLIGVVVYVWLFLDNQYYRDLAVFHLFLLTWASVGLLLTGWRSTPKNTFAFLIKSVEAVVTGGVYLIASMIFSMIALQTFQVLGFDIPGAIQRLAFVGPVGLIPVLAIATVYDPPTPPDQQEFKRGVGRLIITFPRILLGLTAIVLAVYLIAIPFNFKAPFYNRDVLITYNIMLFAVMGLLVGATPVDLDDLKPRYQRWLRIAIVAVTVLVTLVSFYALAAIVFRTFRDVLTINRFTFIGWNTINIGLLIFLLVKQFRASAETWVGALHTVFTVGTWLYVGWALVIIFVTPWIF